MTTTVSSQHELQSLPPTNRDFDVFRAVRIRGRTTRAAANEFQISQTRVRQLLPRVERFLLASVPDDTDQASRERALYVAELLAHRQLEFLHSEAVKMWLRSQEASPHALGKTSYLGLAARIALVISKIPFRELPEFRRDVDEQCLEDARNAHPVGDCSELPLSRGASPPGELPQDSTSDDVETTCDELSEEAAEAQRAFFGPAQPAMEALEATSIAGVGCAAPSHPADHPSHPPLNRQERRARQRQLDKLRRKAK